MWWIVSALTVVLGTILIKSCCKWLYIIAKTYRRDLAGIRILLGVKRILKDIQTNDLTIHKQFMKVLGKNPNKVAIYFENETWTYSQINAFSNKIGRIFSDEGYKKGDAVAIYYENRPEFVGTWLGLSKIGCVVALVNTNLLNDALLHSLRVAQVKALIFGTSFVDRVEEISPEIGNIQIFQLDDSIHAEEVMMKAINLTEKLSTCDSGDLDILATLSHRDKLFYMFTSGTTGLPKAAIITHGRFSANVSTLMLECTPDDVFYDPLPLYHYTPAMAIGLSLLHGLSCVIRKSFSASLYFQECATYNCTAGMYVGEICRYIVNAAPKVTVNHDVKKMFGNGLRKEPWIELVKKFNITRVFEYYGATEGNVVLANLDNRVGSVGFIPRYLAKYYKIQIVKYDEEKDTPIRDENGRCIRCDCNEVGLVIGRIERNILSKFRGYTDEAQTHGKILCDVFKPGDRYFNTGDLMEMDELGYVYFKDRTGDTFRWKAENVSTMEVEEVFGKLLNHADVVVFGVEIPGNEGKAGMAVICDPERKRDIKALSYGVNKQLAAYAVPLFLRVAAIIPATGNFKMKKTDFRPEGFNVHQISDPLYFFDIRLKEYVPLTSELYAEIISNKVRV